MKSLQQISYSFSGSSIRGRVVDIQKVNKKQKFVQVVNFVRVIKMLQWKIRNPKEKKKVNKNLYQRENSRELYKSMIYPHTEYVLLIPPFHLQNDSVGLFKAQRTAPTRKES